MRNGAMRSGLIPGRPARAAAGSRSAGFTLIELLIVVAIIGILASMALLQLRGTKQRAMESALKENLYVLRNCIDQYFTDKGKYPDSLETLVEDGYLRKIPVDPFTESDSSWVTEEAAGSEDTEAMTGDPSAVGGVADVHSGATGTALDGTAYSDW